MFALSKKMIFLFLVLTAMPSMLLAGDGSSKIAVIDINRAVLQTEKAQVELEKLKNQTEFKSNLESIEKLEKEYKKMAEKYQKDRAVMSAEKQAEAERRILEKEQDLKYIASKLQQAQKEWAEGVLKQFASSAQQVLEGIIKEQNIGLLLRRDAPAVIHADASYDISDQVTERLNAIK